MPYIATYVGEELHHYGVPGMKWGVRKDKYTSLSKSGQTKAKIDYFNKKIKSTGDDTITGRVLNDYRRGRVQGLKAKYSNRKAKETYLKQKREGRLTTNAKNQLAVSRLQRAANMLVTPGAGLPGHMGNITRGRYKRYRDKGEGIVKSAAIAAVTTGIVPGPTPVQAIAGGAQAVQMGAAATKSVFEKFKK